MYCSDPERGELRSSGRKYENDFIEDYEEILKKLDKYIYLIDMYKIIDVCAEDLENVCIGNKYEFWKANKCLLNYVNAVFSFKEFIRHNDPSVDTVSEPYWQKGGWYRLICELRNRIVHQSTIIKDYYPGSGQIFINLDELITRQQELAADPENRRKKEAAAFVKQLESIRNEAEEINDQYYLEMKYVSRQTGYEIREMFQKLLEYLYEDHIQEMLEKLISMVYWEKDVNQYVFIVDNAIKPFIIYEPNTTIEQFYLYIQHSLGEHNSITTRIGELLSNNKYTVFYDTDEDKF